MAGRPCGMEHMHIIRFLGKREYGLGATALAFIVLQVYLDLKLPDYMQTITTLIVTPGTAMGRVLGEGALMLGCALGSMLATVVTGYCMAVIGTSMAQRMRAGVFDATLDFSMAEIGEFSTPSLITRSTNDVTQIQMFIVMAVQLLVRSPIVAVWAILKISDANMTWTLATGAAVAVLLTVLGVIAVLVTPRMMRMQRITDDLNRVTREHLSGLRVIRAYNSQGFHGRRFEAANAELTGANTFVNNAFAFLMPSLTAIMSGLSLAIYVLGAVMIDAATGAERLTLFSQMIVFSAYALQIVGAFMMLAFVFIFMPRARVAWRRIREVLSTEPGIADGAARVGRSRASGEVEFRNVSFRYPDAEDDALKDVSFTARPGQTVAIIGSTGSGKSSIVNLVPRFYDVREGQVLVDGRDVREWEQKALRDRISFVPQRATLFSGTIASNIDFGRGAREVTPRDVVEAAEAASAVEFIAAREGRYASAVAQGGSNFSGGQKQRLAIARAVARGGGVMIFDDSFSALDYKTDRDVRAALRRTAADATVIIVAQRIGTVRGADRILVVDRGRIVGAGTHSELLETCSVYREIALSQLSEEELAWAGRREASAPGRPRGEPAGTAARRTRGAGIWNPSSADWPPRSPAARRGSPPPATSTAAATTRAAAGAPSTAGRSARWCRPSAGSWPSPGRCAPSSSWPFSSPQRVP